MNSCTSEILCYAFVTVMSLLRRTPRLASTLGSRTSLSVLALFVPLVTGCGDDSTTSSSSSNNTCDLAALAFEAGDPNGHADPFGAKAAGQARAGRVQASQIAQPAHGRQQIQDGDFVLVNDKIAVFIEDMGISDGYSRFGGEILSLDQVGADGKPAGKSYFMESIPLLSLYQVNPESVTVMNDGSNGEPAVVRVIGPLQTLPFLEAFKGAFSTAYEGMPGAYEYVLAPGSEKVELRFGLINTSDYPLDTGLGREGSDEFIGFFQGSFSQLVTPEDGYAKPKGTVGFIGFDTGDWSFAYTGPGGTPLEFGGLEISGFSLFTGEGFIVEPCEAYFDTRFEIVAGGPGYDGLREAVRRANGGEASPTRVVTGVLRDGAGAPVGDAWVHLLGDGEAYLSRTKTAADGSYTLNAPATGNARVVPQKAGYPTHAGSSLGAGGTLDLDFAPNGFIHVVATDATSSDPLPVRIQVIPAVAQPATPAAWGVLDETNGRLHQIFEMDGDATIPVPPGNHRVIVSRGFEYEIVDVAVDVAAGATVDLPAPLLRSVDTTGVLCGDFHIHSHWSADSPDPRDYKVRAAVADGVEVPASSEHEWIGEFSSIISALGLEQYAFSVPSLELTTFTWGHFGVLPVLPKPGELNNGAFEWLGKSPSEVFSAVHALPEKPMIIVNHPSGGGFQAYFSAAKLDRATGTSSDPLWDDRFEAVEVFNDSGLDANREDSVADWFALLNSGRKTWAVGSSDSHKVRSSPVGFPRTCMRTGYDDPQQASLEDVRDVLSSGQSTISGGLYMSVEGPGGAGPGSTLPKGNGTASFTVTVQAPSWLDATELEVIVNGVTVSTEPLLPVGAGPGKRWVNQVDVTIPNDKPLGWVVFHARSNKDLSPLHPGKEVFAVSNPVLFQ